MSSFMVHDEDSFLACVSAMRDGLDEGKRQMVKLTDKRSLDANSQIWVWIPKIAEFMSLTIPETEKELKLEHGLPILMADPEDGRKIRFILDGCNFDAMTREQQANIVHFLPVTRLFSTKQHNAYRDSIQIHFARLGLVLEYLK